MLTLFIFCEIINVMYFHIFRQKSMLILETHYGHESASAL